ncbi:3-deoxy-manno-octulosonate cytidylyltransferase [Candidatus Halobeggiatoa sp. HSG11]|nr:3-deoxy-manno-octulosonate cytidylyltransferase [Candidatus Halobeggiatoa sp. HSG11]
MNNLKTIVVIPARLKSSRLPNKVLIDIAGKPMLQHVYERCLQINKVDEVHVVTDSEEIVTLVTSWGGKVWMTGACTSGTERIVAILDKLEADIIINVQADQPLIEPNIISQLIEIFATINPLPDIVTPAYPIKTTEKLFDPNLVKIVRRHDGYALYFSRNPIPYVRDFNKDDWIKQHDFFGHVGIYGYKRAVLEEYAKLPESSLEQTEKLEQLKFLQAGRSIYTFVTEHDVISVDTQADLEQVYARL